MDLKFPKIPEYVRKQLIVSFLCYLGNIPVGLSATWSSPMIVKLQDPELTPLPYVITDAQASWMASISFIGGIVGPNVTGKLSNIIGRKYCYILGALMSSLGFCLLSTAYNVAMLYAARLIISFGVSTIIINNYVYIGEISSKNIRGILVALTEVFMSIGSLIPNLIGPFISYAAFHYFALAVNAVFLIATVFIPESPAFYVIKGQEEKAKKAYINLGRAEDIEEELDSIAENIKKQQQQRKEYGEIFTIKSNRKGFIICVLLLIVQNCSGIAAIAMFSLTIFHKAGTTVTPELANILYSLTHIFGSSVAPIFIERAGRKTLLLISTAGCSICMALLGVYFYLDDIEHTAVDYMGWLPLVALLAALTSYNAGTSTIPSVFVVELFRSNVRSIASSITMSIGYLAGFLMMLSFGYIMSGIGIFAAFFMFSIINAFGLVFTAIFVPETKGLSLREIQKILSR